MKRLKDLTISNKINRENTFGKTVEELNRPRKRKETQEERTERKRLKKTHRQKKIALKRELKKEYKRSKTLVPPEKRKKKFENALSRVFDN